MTLGEDVAWALPGLRAAAESRMSETVTVGLFRDGTDPATGDPTRVLVEERYTGRARIRWNSREVTNADGAGGPVSVQEPYLSVPFGSPRFLDRDEVRVVASASDPILVGRWFSVQGDAVAGQTSAHRYPLLEV